MQQELLSCPVHLSSLPVFSEVRVARCLGFSVMFCGSLLDLLSISSGHCIVCFTHVFCLSSLVFLFPRLSNLSTFGVPHEDYSSYVSCALN